MHIIEIILYNGKCYINEELYLWQIYKQPIPTDPPGMTMPRAAGVESVCS